MPSLSVILLILALIVIVAAAMGRGPLWVGVMLLWLVMALLVLPPSALR
jgi:hypothetical protein